MFKEDSYIKSIEKYFLTHLEKGLMLSYSDYELIKDWKGKNIPAKVILEGIKEAFSEASDFDKEYKIRNLNSISKYINKSIEAYSHTEKINSRTEDKNPGSFINKTIESINSGVNKIEDERVLEKVIQYKNTLLNLKIDDDSKIFSIITKKQNTLYNDIFNLLSAAEKNKILKQAKSKILDSANMTEQAYNKSVISFRNTLIKSRHNLDFLN